MATPAQVRATSLAGQFAALTDDQIAPFLLEAQLHLERDSWGDRYDLGLALLTAHLLALELAGGSGSGGVRTVVSERLGPASRTYATAITSSSAGEDPLRLGATRYGQRYAALRDNLPLTPFALFDNTDVGPGDGYA